MNFKFTNKFLYIFILLIILSLIFFGILQNKTVTFVNILPYSSNKPLTYLNKTIYNINDRLEKVDNSSKMHYQTAYGSGFLKKNPAGNDLDYTVGVHLGKIKINGSNKDKFADILLDRIDKYMSDFYDVMNDKSSPELSTDIDSFTYSIYTHSNRAYTRKVLSNCLKSVLKRQDYQVNLKRDEKVYFPILMGKDELLVQNFPEAYLYTNNLKYNDSMFSGIREITIIFTFYCDIEYTNPNGTKELFKNIEVNCESFEGIKLPLSKHFFAVSKFVGHENIKFLKDCPYLNNDELFVKENIELLTRYYIDAKSKLENKTPLKALKRIHQMADVLSPAMDPKVKDKLYSFIEYNLNDKDILLCNDINTLSSNMVKVVSVPSLFKIYSDSNDIEKTIVQLNISVDKLTKDKPAFVSRLSRIKSLLNNTEKILNLKKSSNREISLKSLIDNLTQINAISNSIMMELLPVKTITNYNDLLINNVIKAGYRPVKLYWFSDGTIGILQSELNRYVKIPESSLGKYFYTLGAPKAAYRYVGSSEVNSNTAGQFYWFRINPTKKEESFYKNMRSKLLAYKKTFIPEIIKINIK